MSIDVTTADPMDLIKLADEQRTTHEGAKAAAEADLVPKGRYDGQITQIISSRLDERETRFDGSPNPMFGKRTFFVRAELYDDQWASPRSLSFDVSGAEVPRNQASRLGSLLAEATGTTGEGFGSTLKVALDKRLSFDVGIMAAREQWAAKNTIRNIKAASNGSGY